jgi:hypothetical protein
MGGGNESFSSNYKGALAGATPWWDLKAEDATS